MAATKEQPTDSLDIEQTTAAQPGQRQPEDRIDGDHSEALRGLNADDNSGSGGSEDGHALKGKNVAPGTQYDAPGNAAEGDVGGSTTSSGSGVSGGETGQVTL